LVQRPGQKPSGIAADTGIRASEREEKARQPQVAHACNPTAWEAEIRKITV
jgi:hypothetical protein